MITTGKICLTTFSTTCGRTIDLITYLKKNTHPSFEEFNALLIEYDLMVKISKIRQLITELIERENDHYVLKQSVKMAITDVDDSVREIQDLLSKVKTAKEYHETLYFNNWRKTDCTQLIQSLKMANTILCHRFNDLEKIIAISKFIE